MLTCPTVGGTCGWSANLSSRCFFCDVSRISKCCAFSASVMLLSLCFFCDVTRRSKCCAFSASVTLLSLCFLCDVTRRSKYCAFSASVTLLSSCQGCCPFFLVVLKSACSIFWLCSKRLSDEVRAVAKDIGCDLFEGTYGWTQGPGYETRAEVLTAHRLGASFQ